MTNDKVDNSDVIALLQSATDAGVFLYCEQGALRFKLSVEHFPQAIKTQILANKPKIIAFLQQHAGAPAARSSDAISTIKDKNGSFELSFAQQRLWFIDKLEGSSAQYNMAMALNTSGKINPLLVEQCLAAIVNRHAPLRTRFETSAKGAVQHICNDVDFKLTQVDLSDLDEQAQQLKVNELAINDSKTSFDLAADLMLRACFIHLSAQHNVLLINMHHIACDGWSMGIFVDEFLKDYQARLENRQLRLPELAVDYVDYSVWQRSPEQRPLIDNQVDYWQKQLDGAPLLHSLPLDHERPKTQQLAGAKHDILLDSSLASAINKLASQQQMTLFMVLHATFSLLLSRHSDNGNTVIGMPIANRLNQQLEPMIGLFVNTVVLRTDCTENVSFTDYLRQVKQVNVDALANQDVPFDMVVEKLNPVRDLAYSPIFQIMFTMDAHIMNDMVLPGLIFSPRDVNGCDTKFDLSLNVSTLENTLGLTFEYNKSLFEPSTISRFGDHFVNLLKSIVAAPRTPIHQLEFLGRTERQQLLNQHQPLSTKLPAVDNLVVTFEAQVSRLPNAVAVVDEAQSFTYEKINAKANQLAHHLIKRGVTAEQLVGLSVPRCSNMVIGILAILKAGGAYVPLDPAYPQERLDYMVQFSGLTIVLSEQECNDSIIDQYPTSNPGLEISPNQLAYVIFTSGSTGQPKGVMVEHGNVHRLLTANQADFGFDESDVWCLFHSYAFDFSVWEFWGPLAFGGRLVIVPQWVSRSPLDFYALVKNQKVTILNQTPTAFTQFNQIDAQEQADLALRTIIFGGEALNFSELRDWVGRHGDNTCALVNMYGITETTVHATYRKLRAQDISSSNTKGSLIGQALTDLNVYVLDGQKQPVPAGTTGEIYIGGPGVARGYLNQAQLTAERFTDNPYCAGQRLYRSGDLARMTVDGELEYLGRIDEQVKIHGFRIELGEIEKQLSALAQIDSCVVVVNEDIKRKQLVAYIKAAQGVELEQGELVNQVRSALLEILPVHMLPAAFMVVTQWPLTNNGKVNKKALPQPDISLLQGQYVAPRNECEKLLCQVWQDILGLEKVGIEDNFFHIGGDSILSIQVTFALKRQDISIIVRDLFEYQSIVRLAAHIQSHQSNNELILPALTKRAPAEAAPLSFSQRRLWFIDQLDGNSTQYNLPGALLLEGEFNQQAFERAFNQLVMRHEILRTVYEGSDEVTQRILPDSTGLQVSRCDLSAKSEQAQQQMLEGLREVEVSRGFDLSRDFMIRASVVTLAANQQVALFTLHHIAADGWSMAVLVNDFSAFYQANIANTASMLAPLNVQYSDYAAWQNQWLQGDILQKGLDYWSQQLDGIAPVHSLPLDFPRPAEQTYHGANHQQLLTGELVSSIDTLCQQHSATQFMLLETAFSLLISRYSQQNDVVIGSPIAGRMDGNLDSLIGFFINNLVLRTNCKGDSTFAELLEHNKQTILDAYEHQYLPFDVLVEHLNPQRNLSHDAIFQIVFGLNNNIDNKLELPGLKVSQLSRAKVGAKVELELAVTPQNGRLLIDWTYNTAIFTEHSITALAESYATLLSSIVAQPALPCNQLTMLTPQRQQNMLNMGQQPAIDALCQLSLLEQFGNQVARVPDAVAIQSAQGALSYREFDQLSSRLAAYLQETMMEVDIVSCTRVGICLPRSIAQSVAMMGIHKAGASYVALEPGLPSDRLSHMISDAEVELVLVSKAVMDNLKLAGVDVLLMDDVMSDNWLMEFAGEDQNQAHTQDHAKTIDMNDEAYVLYTSGSTGKPKGVQISHQNLSHYLAHAQQAYLPEYIEGSVVSSPLCFDATLTTLLTPLCVGKSIHLLADGDEALSQLPDYLFDQQRNWLFKLTPAHLDALIYSAQDNQVGNAKHIIVVGGEQLRMASLKHYKQQLLPQSRFVNEYGPTETVVGTSIFTVDSSADLQRLERQINVPIGQAIAGSQLMVLGDAQQLQPVNAIGELVIAGQGVGQGYLNLEQQTDQSFVDYDGLRAYKTGDLVRWLPSGDLAFIGRADHQVKIRGYRIELGEISEQLLVLDNIREAVVVARPNEQQESVLVAYVVASPAQSDNVVDDCRSHLQAQLPQYMVPLIYVLLDEMPLTANGKVDVKALPTSTEALTDKVAYTAPQTEIEQQLCQVMAQVTQRDLVGIEDNFFSIGGDSILSIRVVSLLKRQQVFINIKDIFAHQTVRALAAYINTENRLESAHVAIKPFELLTEQERSGLANEIDNALIEDAYPLSTLQAGMVFHSQLENFNGVYHDVNAEHIKCPWHQAHFHAAFATCISAHPILRSRYDLTGERPLQRVYPQVDVPLVVEDLRNQSAPAQQAYLDAWMQARKLHTFDWSNGPLLQINVFLRTDNSFEFAISFHHSVLDGWSRASLTTELYGYYQQLLNGQTIAATEQQWLYREYIALELASIEAGQAKPHFEQMLLDAPTAQVPLLNANVNGNRKVSGKIQAKLAVAGFEQHSKQLIELAKTLGVPLQAVLLALHFKVLSTINGQSRAMSCITVNGRPEIDGGEQGLGLFLNSVPMQLTLAQGSWSDLIGQVAQLWSQNLEHRHYPAALIQQNSDLELSEVLFNYTHFHVFEQVLSTVEVLASTNFEQTNFDFLVDIQRGVTDDSLKLDFTYDEALYSETLVKRIGQFFMVAVEAMLADVNKDCYSLNLFNQAKPGCGQMQVVDCVAVHHGFEQQVLLHGQMIAVKDDSSHLSYQQLNIVANQLARYLVTQGVTSTSIVGITVPRSVAMVVSVLAVLKAGAAYLPLEASYPQQRLDYLLQDSGITLCLSHASQELPRGLSDIRVDLDLTALTAYNGENLDVSILPEQLAYMIYTSGSTGQPKGVKVPHSGVVNYLAHAATNYLKPHHLGAIVSAPLSFDATVTSVFTPLIAGKQLRLLAEDQQSLVDGLLQGLFEDNGDWLFKLTPAHLEMLAPLAQDRKVRNRHVLVLGGEQLTSASVAQWQQHHLPKATFINEYGPTETVVGCCTHQIDSEKLVDSKFSAVMIGQPIQNTQLSVLNQQMHPVPVGTIGELYIGGQGVTLGYHNREELTQERFVEDGKLYRSGDLVRYHENGLLEYIGREDEQVKVRGYRIELGEIGAQLSALSGVDEAVVIMHQPSKELVAYVVNEAITTGASTTEASAELKAQLAARLPVYMVPQHFVVIDHTPLTSNGKVDKKALPSFDINNSETHQYIAPTTELEHTIAQVWSTVLGLEQVSVTADFFEIGGHSLLATRVLSLLQQKLSDQEYQLNLSLLFEYPTIELLAKTLTAQQLLNTMNQSSIDEDAVDFEEDYL